MRAFRFRAGPALTLRLRQDEAAQGELAAAQRAEQRAAASVAAADQAVDAALAGSLALDVVTEPAARRWHRNWITRQRQELADSKGRLSEREAETLVATDRARVARRRLRSLERLRDRAWRAHQHESSRLERRELDLLANLRYVARRRLEGGTE